MFFRNKRRPNDVEGYDRISRMIEDRQAGGEHDDDFLEEDTVLLSREAPAPGREAIAADELSADESVTLVRPPERGSPFAPPAVTMAPAPTMAPLSTTPAFATSTAAFESPRMSLPDTSLSGAQAGAVSLIAKDAVWEGKLLCTGNVRVEGQLRGEVETSATLFVAADAIVDGTVRALNVTLAGEIKGDLHCEERLEILPGGAARGEVNTGTLVVHEGAFIDSRFQMRRAGAAE